MNEKYRVITKHSSDNNSSSQDFHYRRDAQAYIKHQMANITRAHVATPVEVSTWREGGRITDWKVNVKGPAPYSIRWTIENIE